MSDGARPLRSPQPRRVRSRPQNYDEDGVKRVDPRTASVSLKDVDINSVRSALLSNPKGLGGFGAGAASPYMRQKDAPRSPGFQRRNQVTPLPSSSNSGQSRSSGSRNPVTSPTRRVAASPSLGRRSEKGNSSSSSVSNTATVVNYGDFTRSADRAKSPEVRAKSPEVRAKSPEVRAQSPEPRPQSPEMPISPRMSPENGSPRLSSSPETDTFVPASEAPLSVRQTFSSKKAPAISIKTSEGAVTEFLPDNSLTEESAQTSEFLEKVKVEILTVNIHYVDLNMKKKMRFPLSASVTDCLKKIHELGLKKSSHAMGLYCPSGAFWLKESRKLWSYTFPENELLEYSARPPKKNAKKVEVIVRIPGRTTVAERVSYTPTLTAKGLIQCLTQKRCDTVHEYGVFYGSEERMVSDKGTLSSYRLGENARLVYKQRPSKAQDARPVILKILIVEASGSKTMKFDPYSRIIDAMRRIAITIDCPVESVTDYGLFEPLGAPYDEDALMGSLGLPDFHTLEFKKKPPHILQQQRPARGSLLMKINPFEAVRTVRTESTAGEKDAGAGAGAAGAIGDEATIEKLTSTTKSAKPSPLASPALVQMPVPEPQRSILTSSEWVPQESASTFLADKELAEWSIDDVGKWVSCIGLGHLAETFTENLVSGMELQELTIDDLEEELLIRSPSAREHLITWLQKRMAAEHINGPLTAADVGTSSALSPERTISPSKPSQNVKPSDASHRPSLSPSNDAVTPTFGKTKQGSLKKNNLKSAPLLSTATSYELSDGPPPKLDTYVTDTLIKALSRMKAWNHEGIFRVSGSKSALACVWRTFNQGKDLVKEGMEVHAIAGALKTYIRELPESLIPSRMYNTFCNLVNDDGSVDIGALKSATLLLPARSSGVLDSILAFCRVILQHTDVNRMSDMNLGIVWGPTILRSNQPEDLAGSNKPSSIFVAMLGNQDEIFDRKPASWAPASKSNKNRISAVLSPRARFPASKDDDSVRPSRDMGDEKVVVPPLKKSNTLGDIPSSAPIKRQTAAKPSASASGAHVRSNFLVFTLAHLFLLV